MISTVLNPHSWCQQQPRLPSWQLVDGNILKCEHWLAASTGVSAGPIVECGHLLGQHILLFFPTIDRILIIFHWIEYFEHCLLPLRQKRPWCFYLMRSSCPLNFVSYNSLQLHTTQLCISWWQRESMLHATCCNVEHFYQHNMISVKNCKNTHIQKFVQLWHILYPVFLDPPSTVWRRDVWHWGHNWAWHDTMMRGHLLLVLTLLYVTVSLQQ